MKITAGKRGDAAREAKDKAENKYYWDKYKRAQVYPEIKKESAARKTSTIDDIRRQIDRLISDGYAKQIFEDDVYVRIDTGYGNRTMSARKKYLDSLDGGDFRRWDYNDDNPEQLRVTVGTERSDNVPFEWEWRASFDYKYGKSITDEGKYELKNDVSTYSFSSSSPSDIEYFAATGEILKALSKLNWEKILTTDPFEGLEDLYKQLPDNPSDSAVVEFGDKDKYGYQKDSTYLDKIRKADIQDAIDEWKKGDKWLYVGRSNKYHEDNPGWDTVYDSLSDGPGYYRYVGETDKFYKVEYMSGNEGRRRMKSDEPAQKDTWQYKSKVRKADFENSVYYPITWWGRA